MQQKKRNIYIYIYVCFFFFIPERKLKQYFTLKHANTLRRDEFDDKKYKTYQVLYENDVRNIKYHYIINSSTVIVSSGLTLKSKEYLSLFFFTYIIIYNVFVGK